MKARTVVRHVGRVAVGAGVLLACGALILAVRDALHRPLPAVGVPRDVARRGGV